MRVREDEFDVRVAETGDSIVTDGGKRIRDVTVDEIRGELLGGLKARSGLRRRARERQDRADDDVRGIRRAGRRRWCDGERDTQCKGETNAWL